MVTGVEARYHRPARYGDMVRVACWCERLGSRGMRFAYEVHKGDERLVTGLTEHVWIETATAAVPHPRGDPRALRATGGALSRYQGCPAIFRKSAPALRCPPATRAPGRHDPGAVEQEQQGAHVSSSSLSTRRWSFARAVSKGRHAAGEEPGRGRSLTRRYRPAAADGAPGTAAVEGEKDVGQQRPSTPSPGDPRRGPAARRRPGPVASSPPAPRARPWSPGWLTAKVRSRSPRKVSPAWSGRPAPLTAGGPARRRGAGACAPGRSGLQRDA